MSERAWFEKGDLVHHTFFPEAVWEIVDVRPRNVCPYYIMLKMASSNEKERLEKHYSPRVFDYGTYTTSERLIPVIPVVMIALAAS